MTIIGSYHRIACDGPDCLEWANAPINEVAPIGWSTCAVITKRGLVHVHFCSAGCEEAYKEAEAA